MSNNQRVAVITGAAQGIGKCTAEVFGERGYALVLCDLQKIDVAGAIAIQGDICDEAVAAKIADAAMAKWGRVDVLVNNAGISCIAPAETLSVAEYRRVLEINLVAPFILCQALGKIMLRQAAGSIVNIASIAGLVGVADRTAYNASKHGLVGLTRTLAAEWGGRGVRVNAVCPGWVKTEMDHADQASAAYTDADIVGRIPMARFAQAADIAKAVAFLADSEESGFVNGHTLVVDGGWTADGSWETLRLRHR